MWTGRCLCGAVRFSTDAAPLWICHCHCEMCRRQTGSPLATYVGFPAGAVSWLGREPTRYRSSADVERSFCPVCGSTIGYHRVHETSLALGTFDQPAALLAPGTPALHVWTRERIAWFDTIDDWPRHFEFPPGRAEELEAVSGRAIGG